MGSVPLELSLDFRPTLVPKTINDFLKQVCLIGNVTERLLKLDDFVKQLEEEMRKIGTFNRELPLCMFLLNDAHMPHLSLLYGNLTEEERKRALENVTELTSTGRSIATLKFTMSRLVLYKTQNEDTDQHSWEKVMEYNLRRRSN